MGNRDKGQCATRCCRKKAITCSPNDLARPICADCANSCTGNSKFPIWNQMFELWKKFRTEHENLHNQWIEQFKAK